MDIDTFFSHQSNLTDIIPGYVPRNAQREMANAIAEVIDNKEHLIAEAGTGTGKTFAYLVPAIFSRKQVIISTGTKNLQDQLFNKDLPLLKKAIPLPFDSALLKGRANYLCLYRLGLALDKSYGFDQADTSVLTQIKNWSKHTSTGDISEIADVNETDPVWSQATSNADNCLGNNCPDYSECFLVKARRLAQQAEIIVVNHHLLCADWSLRETGFGELLPEADVIIIDEAHQLSDIASNFLGLSVTTRQLNELVTDTLAEYFAGAKDMPDLQVACENLQRAVRDLRLAFGIEIRRDDWQGILSNPKIIATLDKTCDQLLQLTEQLAIASVRSEGLASCFDRVEALTSTLDAIIHDDSGRWIRWYETHTQSLTLTKTPLNVATEFQIFMQRHPASWIFTSATLSVATEFNHFSQSLGLEGVNSKRWESPFEFESQGIFYHPKGLPQPSDPDFTEKVVEFVLPVLDASQGRAFFLFTSYRALNIAAEILADRLEYPLLVQGTRAKSVLLSEFKQQGNAVLLATSSFWEGIDVRGETLSCVIIDKLPFASPSDPVLKARLQAIEEQGNNPFFDYQLPRAIIALRQGVGRLIRDVNDRGVLMICDPRLLKRSYGQLFLDSIPAMRRTRDIREVEKFFNLGRGN